MVLCILRQHSLPLEVCYCAKGQMGFQGRRVAAPGMGGGTALYRDLDCLEKQLCGNGQVKLAERWIC